MPTMLSAGVYISEKDESTIVPSISNNVSFFAGEFTKGPVDAPYVITRRKELIDVFGLPTNKNYNEWFQCSKYLDYANQLIISRGFEEKAPGAVLKPQALGEVNITLNQTGGDAEFKYPVGKEGAVVLPSFQIGDIITLGSPKITDVTVTSIEFDTSSPADALTCTVLVASNSGTIQPGPVDIFNNSFFHCNGETEAFEDPISSKNIDYDVDPKVLIAPKRLSTQYEVIKNKEDFEYKLETQKLATAAAIKFFAKTPSTEKIEIAIAHEADFAYATNPQGPNKAVAFRTIEGKYSTDLMLVDLFQYHPNQDEIAIALKQGDDIETYIVSFDESKVDGNNKSMFIENVINERSSLVYAVRGSGTVGTYLVLDKEGELLNKPVGPTTKPLTVQGGKSPELTIGAIRAAYETVEDKERFEIDVIIGNEKLQNAALDLADKRKDCIAYVGAEYNTCVGKKAGEATQAIVDTILDTKNVLTKSMFGAYFGNYFRIFDGYNKKYRWINVAGDMAGIRCAVTTSTASWFVAGGERRGIIRGIDKMAFTPSQPMRDNLYKNSINPLVTFPGTGHLVWGNKTLQSYASSFDRINVRGMFNTIERSMAKAARSEVFELNDAYTRNAILAMYNPYLAGIKAARGVIDFMVVCDESNNTPDVISRNELRVDIYIKPNYASEFIQLNFVNVGTRSFASVVGA